MRAFQDAGHVGVLIIGDYTTRIGDPSGPLEPSARSSPTRRSTRTPRPTSSRRWSILDRERTEVRYNGEWLSKLTYAEVVRLARTITVARMLERDDFAKRMAAQQPISVSELLYPLMQAYDSVAVEADVELGGTDQLYNLLAGREVMGHYGLEPQVVLTTPLAALLGRREDELVAGEQHPADRAAGGDVRPDDADPGRARAATGGSSSSSEVSPVAEMHGVEARARPADRRALARAGRRASRRASTSTQVVRRRESPDEVPDVQLPGGDPVHLPALLVRSFGVASTSEARRLIDQGGVKLAGVGRTTRSPIEADVELGGTDQLYNLLAGPRGDGRTTGSSRRSC